MFDVTVCLVMFNKNNNLILVRLFNAIALQYVYSMPRHFEVLLAHILCKLDGAIVVFQIISFGSHL